ncbi:MAG: transcription antitermination factor NusB [Desulfovibrionaceae bacterium]
MAHTRESLPPARAAALACLDAVLRGGQDVQAALDHTLRHTPLGPQDRGLATELCYGYLRLKGRLDAILEHFLRSPEKLPSRLRLALGVAVYELLFLAKVPDYASVDWAVTFARTAFHAGLGKVANGVLRNVARTGADASSMAFVDDGKGGVDRLWARYYACPEWLVRLWRGAYGDETAQAYLRAGVAAPPTGVRVNMRHAAGPATYDTLAQRDDCVAALRPGLAFAAGAALSFEERHAQGILSFQSLAAQEALQALRPESWDGPIWDACAGRGGKTLALVEQGRDDVLASDPSARRMAQLPGQCARLGLPDVPVAVAAADGAQAPFEGSFGAILLDVPCSGLGVLSRRPDAKWRRTPGDLETLVRTQQAIVRACAGRVRPGGRLAYITCTLSPAENEEQAARLVAEHAGFSIETSWATPASSPLGEFFFAALFRRS